MRRKLTMLGLESEKLIRLLDIGSDVNNRQAEFDDEQDKAELLCDLLSQNVSISSTRYERPQTSLESIKRQMLAMGDESIGALILSPETDVQVLRRIKRRFQKLAMSAPSEAESRTATAVYLATIASALVFHADKITRLRHRDLKEHFTGLLRKRWITTELRYLFRKACELREMGIT